MTDMIQNRYRALMNSRWLRAVLVAILGIATVAVSAFMLLSVKTVRIFDGKKHYTVHTLSNDVSTALTAAKLASDDYEIISMKNGKNRAAVNIEYYFPVYITTGSKTVKFMTVSGTVSKILESAGYKVDAYDLIEPAADTKITETAYIDYTDIDYVSGSYTEKIPSPVEIVYSSDRSSGTQSIQKGTDGVRQVSYTEKWVNGVSAGKTINNVQVLSAAVSTKKIIGTKPTATGNAVITSSQIRTVSTLAPSAPIELDANGVPVNYKSHMTVQATAYTYTGHNCATGVAPQPGYIAVNPKIIPYGTRMFIKSSDGRYIYGYAVAADTGGFAKKRPTNVDLFFPTLSDCKSFGRRNVEIYILP